MTIWWRLLESVCFKYKARLTQEVLNEIPFAKDNCVLVGKHVDGRQDY